MALHQIKLSDSVEDQDGDQQTVDGDTFTQYNEDQRFGERLGVFADSADSGGSSGGNCDTGS